MRTEGRGKSEAAGESQALVGKAQAKLWPPLRGLHRRSQCGGRKDAQTGAMVMTAIETAAVFNERHVRVEMEVDLDVMGASAVDAILYDDTLAVQTD